VNAREQRLWQAKFEKHLIDAYGPLVKAVGVDTAQLSGTAVYGLATAIMGAVKWRAPYVVKGAFGSRDYLGVLRSMTATELSDLRAKVTE
jgi:hypothetical protein